MLNQFSRTELLFGKEAMDILENSRVAVFGVGGVGGYTVEALVRSGVGAIDVIDDDKVCLTNLNRQIIATRKGIRALLRADLIRLYNKYHDDLGYCPVYVKQSLEDEYQQYHALKGNGVGTNLYHALMALPTEPQEGEK